MLLTQRSVEGIKNLGLSSSKTIDLCTLLDKLGVILKETTWTDSDQDLKSCPNGSVYYILLFINHFNVM